MKRNKSQRGASAVEYGLLVAGIAAGMVFVLQTMGVLLSAIFQQTADDLSYVPPDVPAEVVPTETYTVWTPEPSPTPTVTETPCVGPGNSCH